MGGDPIEGAYEAGLKAARDDLLILTEPRRQEARTLMADLCGGDFNAADTMIGKLRRAGYEIVGSDAVHYAPSVHPGVTVSTGADRWPAEVVEAAKEAARNADYRHECAESVQMGDPTTYWTDVVEAVLGVIPPDPEPVPLIAAVTLADWLEGWCDHEDGATNGPECCVWRKEAATVRNLASQIAFPIPPDPVVAAIREDAVWLAKLARGSSWPGEMAHAVDRAACRVIARFGSDADRTVARLLAEGAGT